MGKIGGGETMRIGEATERVSILNGMRVKVLGESERGTIYNVYVNRAQGLAQIWVNMDSGGARCFRPYHLEVEQASITQGEAFGLLAANSDA
jgi:hypothetical protein